MVNPTIPGKCDLFCVKVNIHKVLISFWLQVTVRMRFTAFFFKILGLIAMVDNIHSENRKTVRWRKLEENIPCS